MAYEYKNFLLKLMVFLFSIYPVQSFFSIKFPLTGKGRLLFDLNS